MNRRSFIARALIGLTAVSLLGRLINGKSHETNSYSERVANCGPVLYLRAEDYDAESGIWPDRSGNGDPPFLFDRVLSELLPSKIRLDLK